MRRRRKVIITASVAVAALAGGLLLGTVGGAALAQTAPPVHAARESADDVPRDDLEFPTNEAGLTFGSAYGATYEAIPDLVSVISDEGKVGYVAKDILFPPPARSLEDARSMKPSIGRVVDVTESDGVTAIGHLTLQ